VLTDEAYHEMFPCEDEEWKSIWLLKTTIMVQVII
jgi:hypothetical protein